MKTKAPASLVKEANEAHDLFMNSWTGIKFNQREFGRACEMMEVQQLHRYLRVPGSKTGFFTFDAYVAHYTGGECSRTIIFDCKRIYRLTVGENAIEAHIVDQMPKKNQLQVARVKKHAPEKVTKALVARAIKEPVMKFAVTAQSVINETKPVEEQRDAMAHYHGHWLAQAVEMFKETIEDFKLIPGSVRDGDKTVDLESKAVMAICNSARLHAGEAIKSAKEKQSREAQDLSETEQAAGEEQETFIAENYPEAVATATSEGRVIHRKSEARN